MECSVTGCIRPVFSKGFCHKHYDEDRKSRLPVCSRPGCSIVSRVKGLCEKHYREETAEKALPCSVGGCERHAVARGLCDAHRKRKERHGHIDPTHPHDWGGKEAHPLYQTWSWILRKRGIAEIDQRWLDDFWAFVEDVGDRPEPRYKLSRKDKRGPYNKENCHWVAPVLPEVKAESHREYMRLWQKRSRDNNREKRQSSDLTRSFGIGLKEYNDMLDAQGGACAICGNPETAVHPVTMEPRRLAVDHCHDSGKVRGLLCSNCNKMLGHAKDSIATLEAAIQYLKLNGID